MPIFEIVFLGFVVASFGIFALVLAGTAWYCRDLPGQTNEVKTVPERKVDTSVKRQPVETGVATATSVQAIGDEVRARAA